MPESDLIAELRLTPHCDSERGQTLVEYALIIALVSLAAIAALGFLSGKIQGVFSKAGNSLNAIEVASTGGPAPCSGATVPECGTVTIVSLGGGSDPGIDDGDTLQAQTSGWTNNPLTRYRYVWSNGTANGAACATLGDTGNLGTGEVAPATFNYPTSEQFGGDAGDPWRVTVYAQNGSGWSTETATACVYVLD